MRLRDLNNALDNFVESKNLSAILIDGEWGIGKTYFVTKYLEKLFKKNYKIAYATLFGKGNIAEVNTDLYNCLSKKQKVLDVVNPVIKLVNAGVKTGTGFNISLGGIEIGNRKIRGSKKRQIICVIDDLERKHDDIDIDQVIGYINNLILQGIKVICLTWSKVLNGNNDDRESDNTTESDLEKYKEKVFDRTYQVTDSDDETLKNVLGENYKYLSDCEFLSIKNIRTYIKANALFNEIINKTKYGEHLGLIFSSCLAVVHEEATREYSKQYKERMKKQTFSFYEYSSAMQSVFGQAGVEVNYNLFSAVLSVYLENDYKLLYKIIEPNVDADLLTSLFYLSDEDRKKQIKAQEKYILIKAENTQESKSIISNILNGWFGKGGDGDNLDLSKIDKNNLYKKLFEIDYHFDPFYYTEQSRIFKEEYLEYSTKTRIEKFKADLLTAQTEKDKGKLFNEFFNGYPKYDDEKQKELLEFFKQHNFFIDEVHGTTTEEKWTLAHTICKVLTYNIPSMISYDILKKGLEKYLLDYKKKHSKDRRLEQRVNGLFEQYRIKEITE